MNYNETVTIDRSTFSPYTGWPRNNGTVDTVDFQDFALINSYFLRLVG